MKNMTVKLLSITALLTLTPGAFAQPSGRPKPPEMTVAQKKCFTDNGLQAPGSGKPPAERPDRSVMEKVDACLKANGLERPPHPPHGEHRGPPPAEGREPGGARPEESEAS